MIRVMVLAGEGDDVVGEFNFQQLPRTGEEITVPAPQNEFGNRIFNVVAVVHIAEGVSGPYGDGPLTVLRYCEEIL